MSTTLTDGVTTWTLPDDLVRIDEHSHSPVRQAITPTLTGALWIDVSEMQGGEPITLRGVQAGDFYFGEITRSLFDQLRAAADVPGQIYTLTWRGTAYQVIWRHEDAPALDAEGVTDYYDPAPTDLVIPTLKFTRIN
ncbi:hypothetical protein [uncultured Zoogloea sp.]|uniref:hypothetical protein n=1 Tax=uncultured Zoogloea sp. TaxID=160237 RepID=UPI002608D89E|nr:hypothetical protein [uncultured Zoogloea sp.]